MSGTTKRRRNRGRRMVITRSTLKPTKQRQTSKVRSLSDLYPLTTNETVSEDSNTALTLQTLNADGTPKRPMNAFMIFARRRRPQVSAENQAMRTGEISKILSKEWVAMPPVIADNYRLSFLSYPLAVRKAILPRAGEAAQGDVQFTVPRLRLSTPTEQLEKAPTFGRGPVAIARAGTSR